MEKFILDKLSLVTQEEHRILAGDDRIDRELYMLDQGDTINARKLLATGKLITLRPHTRFIHFPAHRHDYVEVVYMCQGTTTHLVNDTCIRLQQGELLFMNQTVKHEVLKAGEQDVAVNFIVLPEFFNSVLPWMLCGTNSIGEATAEKMKEFRLVIWGMHGIYGVGKTMDETFGLIETVEKAAQVYMLTAHLPRINTIRDDQMVELAEFFGVNYRKDFLNL